MTSSRARVVAPTGLALALALAGGAAVAAADEHADVCLELADGLGEDAWSAVVEAVTEVVAADQTLFPEPVIGPVAQRIDIHAGHPDLPEATGGPCLAAGFDWTARFSRDFLVEGAELMLEQADRTPGFESSIELEWFSAEERVRSTLSFAGPFDFPSGRCWVDDTLMVEPGTDRVLASGDQGMDVSALGDVVCRRFYDNLPQGGAGQQAVELLPTEVALADGSTLHFAAATVDVTDDAIVVAGDLLNR